MNRFSLVGTVGTDRWGDVFRRIVSQVNKVSDQNDPPRVTIVVSGTTVLDDHHPSMRLLREESRQMGFRSFDIRLEPAAEREVLEYFDHLGNELAQPTSPAPKGRRKKEK